MRGTSSLQAAGLIALLVGGCGESGTGPARTAPPGTMSAKVNGRSWSSTTLVAAGKNGSATLSLQGVMITGLAAEQISITLTRMAGPNTYTLGNDSAQGANSASFLRTPHDSSGVTIDRDAGTVTITRLSDEGVEGTFSFHAGSRENPSAYHITDGIFNARFR